MDIVDIIFGLIRKPPEIVWEITKGEEWRRQPVELVGMCEPSPHPNPDIDLRDGLPKRIPLFWFLLGK